MEMSVGVCGVEARAPGSCLVSLQRAAPRVGKISALWAAGCGCCEGQETGEHGHGGGMQCTMGMH
jgi:hypothetical protein